MERWLKEAGFEFEETLEHEPNPEAEVALRLLLAGHTYLPGNQALIEVPDGCKPAGPLSLNMEGSLSGEERARLRL